MFNEDWENLLDRFAEAFGEAYTLQRGGSESSLEAQSWDQMYEVEDEHAMPQTVNGRELLIAMASYLIDGVVSEPREGDLLTDSSARVWQVLPMAGKPAWERHGSEWLLRCKEVC